MAEPDGAAGGRERAELAAEVRRIDEAGSAPPNLARIFRVEVDDQRSFPLR